MYHTSVCWVAGAIYKRDERRRRTIERDGTTFHGISVSGRGVFTNADYGLTYAGQCKDGYACGLGVAMTSDGSKGYAEHGPDGQSEGRFVGRNAKGTTNYRLYERTDDGLFERGRGKVSADGRCKYGDKGKYIDGACAPDDPRLLALIALVAPVEVRPAAPAPHPPSLHHSPPSNRPMDRPARFAPAGAGDRRGHRGAPPRRRWWLRGTTQQQPHCKARPRSDAYTRFFS